MNFGEAIELLKLGYKVARRDWNGKNMYIYLVDLNQFDCGCQFEFKKIFDDIIVKDENDFMDSGHIKIDKFIAMRTAQGTVQPGWLASQADMLAEDWVVIE